ncbi:polysaccharide deacetylase [Trichoderma arundinaceum]|uniref:Polysaccharide deacetylase n=1 Tax=Trichoderma arundinaceum TaxID=490622 RepID=A0A395NL69_TRIAR|nr:polysaccharide deacetylase [Trichoderma arundinaceum]
MKLFGVATVTIVLIFSEAAFAVPGKKTGDAVKHLLELRDRHCGPSIGSCGEGECCSESGYCGTTKQYCSGSQCQLDYSDSCDTQISPPGESTEDIPRIFVGDVPYAEASTITECHNPGHVALTFDDGPYEYTAQLLDILDEYNVKATFFIAGNNRGKGRIDDNSTPWPVVLRRMRDAGHQLASHTWTHRNLNEVSMEVQKTEMIYNEMAFRNLFGVVPTYMRPPFLECSLKTGCIETMEKLGYHIISTNLDTKDYENDDATLIQNSKDRFSSKQSPDESSHDYIVLAHDVHYQTVVNLTKYIVELSRGRGYTFVTVGECLSDPPENWYRWAPSKRSTDTDPRTGPVNNTDNAGDTTIPNVSKDERCGGRWGTTCKGSDFGKCCSFYGYCGNSAKHCGTGCDPKYGDCSVASIVPRNRPNLVITNTTNGLCGKHFSATCAYYGNKTCCSEYGFCGYLMAHCAAGCQRRYGRCDN